MLCYLILCYLIQTHHFYPMLLSFIAAISFNVTVGTGLLQMGLSMPSTLRNQGALGLLGNFDGNGSNDLIPRGQTSSITDTSDRSIFENFGQTCRCIMLFCHWLNNININKFMVCTIMSPIIRYSDNTHTYIYIYVF